MEDKQNTMMMATNDPVPVVLTALAKAAAEKSKRIDALLAVATLNDVIWDGEKLVSIKSIETSSLTLDKLRRFCAKFLIYGYKSKSKDVICTLIVQRAKSGSLEEFTYPDLVGRAATASDEGVASGAESECDADADARFRNGDKTGVGSVQAITVSALNETEKKRKRRRNQKRPPSPLRLKL